MSDSHGDRSIVEAIKEKYLGQVDGIFHNGDSELKSDDPVWKGIHVVQGNMDFYDEILVKDEAEQYKIHPAILQGRFSNDTQNYKIRKIDGRLSPFQK